MISTVRESKMSVTHNRNEAEQRGWAFMDEVAPQPKMFSWTAMGRLHAHSCIRLTNGLWYAVRYADPLLASKADLAENAPLLP
jgi:hypothetical protein